MDRFDTTEGQLKEYDLLRQEILQTGRVITQIITISISIVGLITAQGLRSQNPFIFLIPLPIILVLSMYVFDQRWVVWLIASYIRKFVEQAGLGPCWETRLYLFRSATKEKRCFTPGQNIIFVEYLLFNFVAVIDSTLFTYTGISYKLSSYWYAFPWMIYLWILTYTTIQFRRLRREGRRGSKLEEFWCGENEESDKAEDS
ncbi:hypothetical protein ACFL47_04125 [Candidatus Latescibacterota bacterium]